MTPPSSGQPLFAAVSRRFQVFSVFRYREYRLFWIGAAFSNLGIWAMIAGRLWLMRTLTESALMLGLVTVSSLGPILLLSMWGGVVADRVNRLKLLTMTRAMFSLMAFLTGILVAYDVIQPWQLIAISLVTGVLLSFDIPSRQAILPNLVDRSHLLNAIVLYSFLFGGAAVIGPSFFARLVDLWGLEGLFFFVGTAYALTVVTLMMMKPMPNRAASGERKLWDDLLAGLSYIGDHRVIISLLAIGVATGIFGASYGTLLPIFADELLNGGVETYGHLLLGMGLGGLAGMVGLVLVGNLKNSTTLQLVTGIGFGLGLALFSRMSSLPASVAAIAIVAGCSTALGAINNTILQSIVDDRYRGRVMSIHQLGWGASAIGGLLMGYLAHEFDARFALTVCGLITAVAIGALSLSAARWLSGKPQSATGTLPGEAGSTAGND